MRQGKRVRIEQLEDRYQSCAGIDVHKQSLSVCVIAPGDAATVEAEVRQYGATTRELLRLSAWLLECGVEATVLESTGVYWKPVWQVLESEGLEVILANAKAVKNFPGKKTDTEDSVWLATLLRKGLVRASLIPSAEVRALRELCRSRVSLVRDRTRVVQRIDKVLQEANIKLSSVVSDVMGVSGQQMMRRMAAGDTDAARLADLALGRLRSKIPELVPALEGRFVEHQRFLLTELLEQYDYLTAKIERFEKEVEARLDPFEAQLGRVVEMPGFDRLSAAMVLAEIGFDITAFPSAGHLCSWAAMCPGNRETGGKRLSGKTRQGNRWLRGVLTQCAWAAVHTRDSYYGALYRRLVPRLGKQAALVAVAHSLLGVIWHLLSNKTSYSDLGADYFERQYAERQRKTALRKLERLGYKVTLEPAA